MYRPNLRSISFEIGRRLGRRVPIDYWMLSLNGTLSLGVQPCHNWNKLFLCFYIDDFDDQICHIDYMLSLHSVPDFLENFVVYNFWCEILDFLDWFCSVCEFWKGDDPLRWKENVLLCWLLYWNGDDPLCWFIPVVCVWNREKRVSGFCCAVSLNRTCLLSMLCDLPGLKDLSRRAWNDVFWLGLSSRL